MVSLVAMWLLAEKIMHPAMEPVARLRDVAVAMSEGDLDIRADENAYGELGELGKAVNQLSWQLSRNMYTLIVERNRLRNMLNGLSEGIVAIDAKGEITHTNPALDKFFTRQKTAVHLPDPRMKVIDDKSVWDDFDAVIQSGESMSRNMQARDMILRMTITPIVDEIGSIAGAVGLFSDITQMERLERTRREYVSNVSHELRTPLTAMRALVEPLSEGMVTEEADRQRYYGIILREIQRLSRLINDQLELSRLQSGNLAIAKSVMALDDVVYDVCDRYSTIAAEHGLELKLETDFTQCPPVYANADRVEQMLIILVDNAIKYTEAGSVTVSADWDDARVVMHVKDTGIGIEENDLPYVFDRFYKVDKAHSGKGSGLGLSIAKELLKRMDEEIWVTSEKGVGTEFSFTIHRPEKKGDNEE
ncbi:MAG: HAMP domain-containing protein [Clostridia bacterium]|nr:HAMP domain-containing protein [Clostridia bacterium]